MIGEVFGSYKLLDRIGEGGMGAVYRAEHVVLGRAVAMKVLLPELSRSPEALDRFFGEARTLAGLHHPGIVAVQDFGHLPDGRAYLVMEILEGEPLSERLLRVTRLPEGQAIALCRQAAGAVSAAHARGIVHRDLKPDNLFLVQDPDVPGGERVKVLDFGIAKLGGGTGGVKTREGVIIGTPRYMAPEQCRAQPVDHRADLYALGCVLFEMLAGRPPFVADDAVAVLTAHVLDAPPTLAAVGVTVSASCEALVRDLLAKSPDDRPASMEAVLERLGAPTGPRTPAAPVPETRSLAGIGATPLGAELAGTRQTSRRGPGVIVAIGAVLMAALGIVLASRGPQQNEPAPLVAAAGAPSPAPAVAPPSAPPAAPPAAPTPPRAEPSPPAAASHEPGARADRASKPSRNKKDARPAAPHASLPAPDEPAPAPPASREPGFLTVLSRPWADVSIDGKKIQQTPMTRREVPAGRHTIELRNDEFGKSKRVVVNVRPGQTSTVNERLDDE